MTGASIPQTKARPLMKITPRPDQWKFIQDINQQWNQGAYSVVGVASTGFGKTVCLGQITHDHPGATCIMAHRGELVAQISGTLARFGVRHNVIGSAASKKAIAASHVRNFGACYLMPSAKVAVASVDTLVRADGLESWAATVTRVIVDEGHHLVLGNKWDAARKIFTNPNVKMLQPTATPERADGKGLGNAARGGSGVADCMVQAPPMRWLIEQGFLCDYRVVCVASDLQEIAEQMPVGASGDWSGKRLKEASQQSKIVGDVVREYMRWAWGKRHVTFTTDIDTAQEMTAQYRAAGVPAECLTGKTNGDYRRDMLLRFERGDLWEIVAVDIISEGFDMPAIEAVSFARPSKSLAVVWQQFGRALRTAPGKTSALILDHVGNILNPAIGLPDRSRTWTLADRMGRGRGRPTDEIPLRVCGGCFMPYERIYKACPSCGYSEPPTSRGSPEHVDGDLAEMSPELLAKLRGQEAQALNTADEERDRLSRMGLPHKIIMAQINRHAERSETLDRLKAAMAAWGGERRLEGMTDSQMQRLFFLRYGVDVLSAQSLKRAEAQSLLDRIADDA